MSIPLYKPYLPESAGSFAVNAFGSGWLGYGPRAKQLENVFTDRWKGWALSVTSCTSALYLAARCMKRSDSDEVIIPAITFVSTGMAFKTAGYKVVPVDVDPQGLISPEAAERAITAHTRAIVAVHLYGQRAELSRLRRLCDARGLFLVEDCAHRVGMEDAARTGDFACFSFNVMKELPSGEGGLLWGRDAAFEQAAREFANVGLTENTVQRVSTLNHADYLFGSNSGLKLLQNDLIASLTLALMPLLEENREKRKRIFTSYQSLFGPLQGVRLFERGEDDSRLMFVLRLKEELVGPFRRILADNGIATSHHYPSLYRHPMFEKRNECPEAARLEREIVSLPCFIEMTDEQLGQIERAVMAFAGDNGLLPGIPGVPAGQRQG